MSPIKEAVHRTSLFLSYNSRADRKTYGQFFTPETTALFMASMLHVDMGKSSLRILDAGAGSGILSVALLDHIRKSGYQGLVELVCYENDEKVLGVLAKNLASINDSNFIFEIRGENYITSQAFDSDTALFERENTERYDLVIGNPPYKKIPKNSPEALHMKSVCHGSPNLYFLFWAMGIHNLKEDGELVYIVPRSWTSGTYFSRFRKYMLSRCTITDIHVFDSRDKVFVGDAVLQETVIVKMRKGPAKSQKIRISSSSTSDFHDIKYFNVDYNIIVGRNNYVYLVTNDEESQVLHTLGRLSHTLVSDDLRMKTGIIVDFRTRKVLRSESSDSTYPLIHSQHFKNGRVVWPVGRENEYIDTESKSYLQENTNYLLVKRITAKEEKRRLQCAIYMCSDYPDFKFISTHNKINYIKCTSKEEAYGLYVLLNSTIYDQYYRILNGSTQVNATEINNMPVPSRETIREMGKELEGKILSQSECDNILKRWIS